MAGAGASEWTARALWWNPSEHTRLNARRRRHRPKRWLDDIFNFAKHYIDMWDGPEKTALQEASTPNDSIHVLLKLAGTDAWRGLENRFADYSL